MATLAAFLLLWGLSLSPAAEGGVFVETRPDLWAEAGSLQEPWAKLTLVCRACLVTSDFQLFKDGELLERVRLSEGGLEHRFPLGAVTGDTRGLYRCRYAMGDDRWTSMSNLLEVTGAGEWGPPSLLTLLAGPSPWPFPMFYVPVHLFLFYLIVYRSNTRGPKSSPESIFPIDFFLIYIRAGNYSCSYRNKAGAPSEPSATVTIEDMPRPPPPRLSVERESGESAAVLFASSPQVSLRCVAPVEGVEFQLRRGDRELRVTSWGTTPGTVNFELKSLKPADSGLYTCRYQLRREDTPWSLDSAPVELLLSDGELGAAPRGAGRGRGAQPQNWAQVRGTLRVQGHHRFRRRSVREVVSVQARKRGEGVGGPAWASVGEGGPGAGVAAVGRGTDPPAPPPRPGPLPKPRLRPLWSGKVSPGRDAVLRCETPVAHQSLELLAAGEVVASAYGPSEDLVLTYVGPQHAGKYSCRYRSRWPLVSELSDPVELQVAGE
uniref:Ig-like domain-containing protein n=1 Tax=Myotis lucifugus TaxID=59463 RepID=G1NTN3_MYOLU